MKNNRGVSIISFILVICILAVIAFLGYQIFYEDILNLGLADSTVINTLNIISISCPPYIILRKVIVIPYPFRSTS